MPNTRSVLAAVALPFLLAEGTGCALFTLASTGRSHPRLEGAVSAQGAKGQITIRRDAHGVPHIDASTENDAWYGLGYVHAQDRLFQLDLRRRLVHGRISEFLGERAVELDAFVQALQLEARGRQVVAESDPATQARMAAYTEGLNAGAASLKTLPVEYRLLGVDFEPWEPVDTTVMLYLLGWGLQENLDHELASLAFAHLSSDDLDALFQTYPDTPPIDPFWEELRTRDVGSYTAGFEAFTGSLGGRPKGRPTTAEASNNWVVGGGRTASGKPILANDPHLVQSVPSIWYAAHVKGGDLHVAGATVPGSPGVLIGHNERVGWGLTNVMADTVDVAVLERDGDALIIGGRREIPEVRKVTVHPKDAEPVEREILTTSIGPVINEGGEVALVLRWTGLTIEDRTPDIITAFAHAESTPQLFEALADLPSVAPQNVVSADVDGHIGWAVMGSIPRRHGFTGRVPHLGSEPTQHWDGMLDVLPGELDPERGYLATANHKPDPAVQPSVDEIATAYLTPHRYDRIMGRLAEMEQVTPADMSALHLDIRENAAATYLPELLDGLTPNAAGAPCYALLQGWATDDYLATVDSAPAAAWGVFQHELWKATFADDFDEDQLHMLIDVMSTGRDALDGDFERFRSDEATLTALDRTCDRLRATFGAPEAARWGAMHHLKLPHPFSAQSSLLKGWDMETREYPGTGASVSPGDYDWNAEEWNVGFMASLRIVMPMDDLGATTFVHPGGQSGQPKSPYYRTHYDAFVDGDVLPLWFDDDDVEANTVHTLVLEP
jgi:penicillin amidase